MVTVALLAFACELIDSTVGMGYGTTLTPLLLLLGWQPLQIVPAILISELVTGVAAAVFHHRLGNSDFRWGSQDVRVALLFSALGVVGAVAAILVAFRLPTFWLTLYIGTLVTVIGIRILWLGRKTVPFSWSRITLIGLVAAFNKGLSGGGYGPLVTGGQLLAGQSRNAVGITSFSEAFTCLVGGILYWVNGTQVDFVLLPALMTGALLSVPISAFMVSRIDVARFRQLVGASTLTLGLVMLAKLI